MVAKLLLCVLKKRMKIFLILELISRNLWASGRNCFNVLSYDSILAQFLQTSKTISTIVCIRILGIVSDCFKIDNYFPENYAINNFLVWVLFIFFFFTKSGMLGWDKMRWNMNYLPIQFWIKFRHFVAYNYWDLFHR